MQNIRPKNEYDIDSLNDAIRDNTELLINKIEYRHIEDIENTAKKAIDRGLGLKIILISGPSAAGKQFCL